MQISDFDKFPELLKYVRDNRMANIERLTINLASARDRELLEIAGLFIYADDATDVTSLLTIQHNELESGALAITKNYGIIYPFYRLFLTNTAQASKTITLTIGRAAPFNVIDNRSQVDSTTLLTSILAGIVGPSAPLTAGAAVTLSAEGVLLAANTARKRATIYNRIGNGLLYVRKEPNPASPTTVTTSNYDFALASGQWEDIDKYTGQIRGLMATTGQIAQVSEV